MPLRQLVPGKPHIRGIVLHDLTSDLRIRCPFCLYETILCGVPNEGWTRWRNGELIQNAFPNMTADQRELLVSGVCAPCWEMM